VFHFVELGKALEGVHEDAAKLHSRIEVERIKAERWLADHPDQILLGDTAKTNNSLGEPAATPPPGPAMRSEKKAKPPWKPNKATLKVIELMKQGLSNDAIAARRDVKVSTAATNLRQIRHRAIESGYLPREATENRDAP